LENKNQNAYIDSFILHEYSFSKHVAVIELIFLHGNIIEDKLHMCIYDVYTMTFDSLIKII